MKKLLYILLPILFACGKSEVSLNSGNNTGVAGSLARFAVVDNTLYTVTSNNLNMFNITDATKPTLFGSAYLGINIETIFPRDNNTLFIGSSNGVLIYDITNKLTPSLLGTFSHVTACDPVVANNNIAYATLRSSSINSRCWRSVNQLIALNISNITSPQLIKTYNMVEPKGLALWKNDLFVCDDGLKRYNATSPGNLILRKNYLLSFNDVIALDSTLICVGNDGLTQYKIYADSLQLLSKIPIVNTTN